MTRTPEINLPKKTYKITFIIGLLITIFVCLFWVGKIFFDDSFIERMKSVDPSWLFGAGTLWLTLISSIGWFHLKQNPETTSKEYRTFSVAIILSVILLALATFLLLRHISVKSSTAAGVACPEVVKDSNLPFNNTTYKETKYITAERDSVDVTKLSCDEYTERKREIKKNLLLQCDQAPGAGHNANGQKLSQFLNEGDTNKIILEELMNDQFLFISEKTFPVGDKYFYKARVCVARRNTLDSLIALAYTKHCIRWVLNDLVFQPLQKEPSTNITISLNDVFRCVGNRCANDKFVIQLKNYCGGNYDCDSLYFMSGHYKLTQASQVVLNCLFEQMKTKKDSFQVVFNGYTDPHRVLDTIPCSAGFYAEEKDVWLPNPAAQILPFNGITSNHQLSYARGYSCYNYVRKNYSMFNVTLKYTGSGESQVDNKDALQRTVKIIINKL